jgi:prepilin-type N-terminal cleavage/methylation domain-containing protein
MFKNSKGFTLIEVVLVLAIAGLLLTLVFLAVTGAQKSRRDAVRKNDLSRIAAQLDAYASNNKGDYPTSSALWDNFWTGYVVTGNFIDPTTAVIYTKGFFSTGNSNPAVAAVPSGGGATVDLEVSGHQYHVCIGLEQGTEFCQNNQ